MKPTVINHNSEVPHQPQHDQQNVNNNQPNNSQSNDHSRRFPQFRQHGFNFDDPDSDVFADMGLRSRLNRMGNPFDWSARKRRGSGQNLADQYDHYFDDVDFPQFGSTWDAFGRMGNKRSQHPHEVNDRSGFFNYVPPEFRQYVPENFGGYFRHHDGRQPQMHPQQQGPSQQQQPHQQANCQQTNAKSNLCDAAIQTDEPGVQNKGNRRDEPHQETENNDRNGANENQSSSSASSASSSTPHGCQVSTSAEGPGAYASASAGNNQNQYYQQSPNHAPPFTRHYQQPHAQQYQYSQTPQQNQYYANIPPSQQQQQPEQRQHHHPSQEGFVRNVPIVLEETGTTVNHAFETGSAQPPTPPTALNKPRPEPLNKESFPTNESIPCPPPASHDQSQSQQQHSDNQQPQNADTAPPQTPHTADCISKIQAIQRDVLELMLAVEQFGGKRGDKDYIYLDEMLTRNLLKLDTIDTNGKESIRLARKEAIKCIQTSIAVLEAKSVLNLNENQNNIEQDQTTNNGESTAVAVSAEPSEKMETDISPPAEQSAADDMAADIPKVENITIDDDNEKSLKTTETQKNNEDNATAEITDDKK